MDLKKVDELLRMQGNCKATTDILVIELLTHIANNTARLVQIEEDKISGQMEFPFNRTEAAPKTTETKKEFTEQVKEKVEEAIEEKVEVKKPAPKKKAAPKKVEEPKPVEVKEEPKAEPKEQPTREAVMEKLVEFIQLNGEQGETKLAAIFQEMGGYATFPAIPEDKYSELLTKIS